MKFVIIAQVVVSWSMLLDKEGTNNSVNPHFRCVSNHLEVINVGTDIIISIIGKSQSHSHTTIISREYKTEGSDEIS